MKVEMLLGQEKDEVVGGQIWDRDLLLADELTHCGFCNPDVQTEDQSPDDEVWDEWFHFLQ